MRTLVTLAFALLALCAASAAPLAAQSFNLDMEPAASPFGTPSSAYGAAAGQAGHWHAITAPHSSNLVAIDGSATTASVTTGIDTFVAVDLVGTTGDDEALFDDFHSPDFNFAFWDFAGLQPGAYAVYTIVRRHQNQFPHSIEVVGSADPEQDVYGNWQGSFQQGFGGNYTRHTRYVHDGTLRLVVEVMGFFDRPNTTGIQIVKLDPAGAPYCFGSSACPCGNGGAGDAGCVNSTGQGARLASSGSASAGADDLRFSAVQMPAGVPSILFVADSPVAGGAGLPFGDGLLCASGNPVRLGVQTTTAGGLGTWGPGLGAQGGWSPGDTRRFQAWYRDAAGPCGQATNLTNGYEVTFGP